MEATCSTLPGGMFAAGTLGAAPTTRPPPLPEAWSPSSIAVAAAPPIPADTTAMANAPAVKSPARERFRGSGAAGIPGSMPGIGPVPGIRPGPVLPNGS
ncbi:hypothetical protein MOTT27_00985 [Mycobacterium intracellulare subsp. yongonense]|nr:hypothetical protein MOTT27_00985 [Mycobacterium intracellulare subsp. yongonense]